MNSIETERSPLLVIGGTTEGRVACEVSDAAGTTFYYSTKTDGQKVQSANGVRLTGGLDAEAMSALIREKGIRLLVDAAHPFAALVHRNIGRAVSETGIPVIRYERTFPPEDTRLRYFDSFDDLDRFLRKAKPRRLLSLAGVSSISRLEPLMEETEVFVRIMHRPDSLGIVAQNRFPTDHLSFYDEGETDEALFRRIHPDFIVTKESGETGGFCEKTEAARALGIPVLVLRRPPLPYSPDKIVSGPHGLRRAIEKLLPSFFELKTGFTTGSCATAATVAALLFLTKEQAVTEAPFDLPDGEPMSMPVSSVFLNPDGSVTATVVKDAGDDADVTDGTEICSTVRLTAAHSGVRFLQGEGVGVVTLPGLGIEIGGPAINPTPRRMIVHEVRKLLPVGGIDVTISIPCGAELAPKTFNPKLGVTGGISVVGTSGIIYPYSLKGWVDSIRKEIAVARALGMELLVLNSGAKSERFVKKLFPDLSPQSFVQYGNFIGETIKMGADEGFPEIALVLMIGKAVKLAEGELDTHSHKTTMHHAFLVRVAEDTGCALETIEKIKGITMARELWSLVPGYERAFFVRIASLCHEVCAPLLPGGKLRIFLIDDQGELRAKA